MLNLVWPVCCFATDYTDTSLPSGFLFHDGDYLVNNGVISDNLIIDSGTLRITNNNTISNNITGNAVGSKVLQIISNPTQMNLIPIGTNVSLDILINNGGDYLLADLDTISQNANSIDINFDLYGGGSVPGLVLVADTGFDGRFTGHIIKESNTQIKLTDNFLNSVSINSDEILRFDNIEHYMGINVREEAESGNYDYYWATCSDGIGVCVKRRYSDSYLAARQSALHAQKVLKYSVQKNPDMLLRPMMIVNRHEILDFYEFSDEFFVSVVPEYYNAKGLQGTGVKLNSGTKIDGRLSVGVSAYMIKSEFKNDVSNFKSGVYGGNLRFNYDVDELLFVRGVGGFSFSDIECDGVVKGNTTKNDPDAFGVYGKLDFGARFGFESGLYLSPFIGYGIDSESVVDIHENYSFVNLGTDVGFGYFMDGVKYNYVLHTGINSHGDFDASIGLGAWAVPDKIGGTVSVGILNTDFGVSGKVSANIKLGF